MIINKEIDNITKSDEFADVKFGVCDEGIVKIIELVSKSMYKNPRQSLMTEFVQNAQDEHTFHKVDCPIEIDLPTKLDPHYRVRDFAAGMDDEKVQAIFSQIGKSTKDGTNELLGAFGLGKLVFAAYNGIMNLTSIAGGQKTCWYCRMFGGEGELTKLMGPEPTDEPNGVLIEIPVKQEDIKYFNETAQWLYAHIEPRPKIRNFMDGCKLQELPKDTTIYDNYKVQWNSKNIKATLGGLPFPVDLDQFKDDYKPKVLDALDDIGLILTFKVGEVDIVPSRDSLRYSDLTKNAIMKIIDEVLENFTVDFQKKLDAVDRTYFEIVGEVSDLRRKNQHALLKDDKIVYRGIEIDTNDISYGSYSKLDIRVRALKLMAKNNNGVLSQEHLDLISKRCDDQFDEILKVEPLWYGKAMEAYTDSWYNRRGTKDDIKWRSSKKCEYKMDHLKDSDDNPFKMKFFFKYTDADQKITSVNEKLKFLVAGMDAKLEKKLKDENKQHRRHIIMMVTGSKAYCDKFKETLTQGDSHPCRQW
jgi:hypothetical protein